MGISFFIVVGSILASVALVLVIIFASRPRKCAYCDAPMKNFPDEVGQKNIGKECTDCGSFKPFFEKNWYASPYYYFRGREN